MRQIHPEDYAYGHSGGGKPQDYCPYEERNDGISEDCSLGALPPGFPLGTVLEEAGGLGLGILGSARQPGLGVVGPVLLQPVVRHAD